MGVKFTIALPTHDRRETVLMAVRSVLAQSRPAHQVIVLCDGCTDGTAEAVRALGDPRVEALELPKGPGHAYDNRNRALERAETEAILWLSDDDLLLPDHLERIGELWDSDRYDVVQNPATLIHPDDRLEWMGADWSVPAQRAAFERDNTNPMSSVSVRTELARSIGGWDGAVARAGDWDLWRRLLAAGARTAATSEPTHLHFRAAGRRHAWPLRVRQNAAWLARIEDPAQLGLLRVALHRTRDEREAAERARYEQLVAHATEVGEHARAVEADRDANLATAASLRGRLGAAEVELDAVRRALAAEQARAAAAEAESARLAGALARIESGGWWRLRERLLPVLRLAGRGDAGR